jgi:hypothetical protein
LALAYGVGFFGFTTLGIGWFETREGVAGPVTDLGYGVLIGIILTGGVLAQLRTPERTIASMQQAALVIPALLIGAAIASDHQGVLPALILIPALGVLLVLHPARGEFLQRGARVSPLLLAVAVLGGIPLITYARAMGMQARQLAGPPHHVLRLTTMAAMAVAILFVGLLAALKTRGWRIPAWCAGVAVVVYGLASTAFPNGPGAEGRGWGSLAIAGGLLFIAVAEREARASGGSPSEPSPSVG